MKICVFGAGAIGGHLAARLARGGADVCVVARGAQLAAIQADGLRVEAPDASFTARVPASADPADLGKQDAVLVTVKAPALRDSAAGIAALLRPDTAAVFVMNGIPWWYFHAEGGPHDGVHLERVDPGRAVRNAVDPARVIGGVIYSACTVTAPGTVKVAGGSRLVLGEPDGRMTPRLHALAAAVTAGGVATEATPSIRQAIWAKLAMNLGVGPLSVLAESHGAALLADPACCDAVRRLAAEVAAVAAAMGCPIQADAERQIALACSMDHKPSILQDLQLGRSMEVDAMFTVPREIARMAGVPTPTLDLLVALTRLRAQSAGLYSICDPQQSSL